MILMVVIMLKFYAKTRQISRQIREQITAHKTEICQTN